MADAGLESSERRPAASGRQHRNGRKPWGAGGIRAVRCLMYLASLAHHLQVVKYRSCSMWCCRLKRGWRAVRLRLEPARRQGAGETMAEPKRYQGIMVSSTFTDLQEHRQKVIEAIEKLDYHPVVMENHGARTDADVIDASLQMVRKSAAYVGLISHKYGQTPYCASRNPDKRSITELEFDEATRLGRPILLFIMGADHTVKKADIETDPDKRAKLDAFCERAKLMRPDGEVQRVYRVFKQQGGLGERLATVALADLKLPPAPAREPRPVPPEAPEPPLPNPPDLRAVPPLPRLAHVRRPDGAVADARRLVGGRRPPIPCCSTRRWAARARAC